MASPPVVQPATARSPAKESVQLHHPLPDLQSLQGAYIGNISRLQDEAERMSESGSDLGEEIRRLHSELKLSDSRRSSLRSTGRSRNVSTSSHANSVIDTNGPRSLRSGSWSIPPASRQRSGSKASRLGQVVHPEQVQEERDDAAACPASPQSAMSMSTPADRQSPPPGQRHVSSFTRKYEEIANEIREEIRNSVTLDRPLAMQDGRYVDPHEPYPDEPYPHYDLPDRPPTAASTDTAHHARTLWHDFDGTHAPDTVHEEPEPDPSHAAGSRHSSFMMRAGPDMPPQGVPPPDDGMVFYPAPVPRMLNLPKRLSQLPAADVAARRRTQVLDQMQAENRKSAPWLSATDPSKPNKKSRQSFAGLPAHLRASAFFDQQGPPQEFEVKGESATDTLDNILEASARAPVSAFTDHPFAGHVGKEVYGPEHKRKTSKLAADPVIAEPTKRRGSFNILDTTKNSTGGKLNKLKKRNSSADMNILLTRASENRMSLGAELDEHDEQARGPHDHETSSQRNSLDDNDPHPDGEFEDQPLDDDDDEEEPFFGAPTTLLAELQLRKAKQKERNMNYVTMVEEGRMTSHRTLLDLNDDAEREKQKRLKKKVQLAWEAQAEDDSDDDIPLGVLYKQPPKTDWDRPLGLIAQRELEDNEPLSRRRNRLVGADPNRPNPRLGPYGSQTNIPRVVTPQPESEGEEQETLGERMRRLKDKQMLEAALGDDVRKSTVSGDFAAEMLSKLGVDDTPEKPAAAPSAAAPSAAAPSPVPEDGEETLGQRRARLQAEAAARGDVLSPGERPALRSKMSLADVLSANPSYDDHNQARKVSNEQLMSQLPAGSLLHKNAVAEERRKAHRLTQNMRASSYNMSGPDPLVRGVGSVNSKNDEDQPLALKIQAYKDKMAGLGPQEQPRHSTMHPMGMPAMNMSQQSMPMPMTQPMMNMSMMQQPMMPQQMMPMPMPMPMMNMPLQHPGMGNRQSSMPMQMSMMQGGPQMNVLGGMPLMQNMGLQNGMGMGMGMPMDPNMLMQPMNTQQRSNIEGWMRGIR